MSEDARLKTDILQHPKIKKLQRRFGAEGPLRFISLILWAASNRPDGDLSGMQTDDIEICVDWPLGEGEFVSALMEFRLLEGVPGSYAIHDWQDHNPWASGEEDRKDRAKFAALVKHHGKAYAEAQMPEYAAKCKSPAAKSTSKQCEERVDACTEEQPVLPDSANSMPIADFSTAPSPSPSPSPSQEHRTDPIVCTEKGGLGGKTKPDAKLSRGSPPKSAPPLPDTDPKPPKAKPLSAIALCEALPGLSPPVASDYLAHRKAKNAPLTESAWTVICREIHASGVPPDEALSEAMAAGWASFKANWLANRNQHGGMHHGQDPTYPSASGGRSLSAVERVRIASAAWAEREEQRLREAGNVIDIT